MARNSPAASTLASASCVSNGYRDRYACMALTILSPRARTRFSSASIRPCSHSRVALCGVAGSRQCNAQRLRAGFELREQILAGAG